jgi:RimJ/RimL family protein N-acetyltransferase
MLKTVYIIEKKDKRHSDAVTAEMTRTVESLREEGFASGILTADSALQAAETAEGAAVGTLYLCECGSVLRELLDRGACAIGYAHADNAGESFSGAPYIVQEPDLVEADSYVKMYQRGAGLPWTILETERCLVREFTAADLDGIYALYDGQARTFLQPPSDDRAHEREILSAYIQRIYGLYGFGHWAVISKEEPGALIGRVGYSAITDRQEREAQALGIPLPDVDFGFLIGAPWRGRGIAEEVCRALLRYGISEIGFTCIRADARNDNAASIRLLTKLGFEAAGSCIPEKEGEPADKTLFILR